MLAYLALHTPQLLTGITIALPAAEAFLRLVPSQKPMGVLIAVRNVFDAVASFVEQVSKALDAVVPQNISTPQA